MFGEFNEAAQPKTLLAEYSIEFDYSAVQMRPHRIAYLRLLGRRDTLLYARRSVGRLTYGRLFHALKHFELVSFCHFDMCQYSTVSL